MGARPANGSSVIRTLSAVKCCFVWWQHACKGGPVQLQTSPCPRFLCWGLRRARILVAKDRKDLVKQNHSRLTDSFDRIQMIGRISNESRPLVLLSVLSILFILSSASTPSPATAARSSRRTARPRNSGSRAARGTPASPCSTFFSPLQFIACHCVDESHRTAEAGRTRRRQTASARCMASKTNRSSSPSSCGIEDSYATSPFKSLFSSDSRADASPPPTSGSRPARRR